MAGIEEPLAVVFGLSGSEEMPDSENRWIELMGELRGIRSDVARIEVRIEKDSDQLFERLRVCEVDIALNKQALKNAKEDADNSRRKLIAIVAAAGSGAGALASLLARLF